MTRGSQRKEGVDGRSREHKERVSREKRGRETKGKERRQKRYTANKGPSQRLRDWRERAALGELLYMCH